MLIICILKIPPVAAGAHPCFKTPDLTKPNTSESKQGNDFTW